MAPFTSTTQMRQAPISLMSFRKHSDGMLKPAERAASSTVEPSGTVTGMSLMRRDTIFSSMSVPSLTACRWRQSGSDPCTRRT
ncbi:Uncharacterised protein [Flavonifractor plautii]|uniref:Uncharacterized protein n=1 Tax=Flavonifractor plautii TaxID=292800 RepID=A0A174P1L5_FLAPL|nr:Uncharacterised protein [Flavonifractor plautii]